SETASSTSAIISGSVNPFAPALKPPPQQHQWEHRRPRPQPAGPGPRRRVQRPGTTVPTLHNSQPRAQAERASESSNPLGRADLTITRNALDRRNGPEVVVVAGRRVVLLDDGEGIEVERAEVITSAADALTSGAAGPGSAAVSLVAGDHTRQNRDGRAGVDKETAT